VVGVIHLLTHTIVVVQQENQQDPTTTQLFLPLATAAQFNIYD
jgi:hypothetical protein